MPDFQIIRTRYRVKIPQALSYPLGAAVISDALAGVSQYERFAIEFLYRKKVILYSASEAWLPTYQLPQFGQIAPSTRYCVLQVQFAGPLRRYAPSRAMDGSGCGDPSWTITVYAVPRSLRRPIQERLVSEALPSVRSWLLSNAHTPGHEGVHGLVFIFDEPTSDLVREEHTSLVWQTERADRRMRARQPDAPAR